MRMNALTSKGVPIIRPVSIMRPGVRIFLMTLREDADRVIFRDEIENERRFQIPITQSNKLLGNEGGGANESKIVLTDMN